MKRKLCTVGQEQESSLPTRRHTPRHRGFPTACHWRDCLLRDVEREEEKEKGSHREKLFALFLEKGLSPNCIKNIYSSLIK